MRRLAERLQKSWWSPAPDALARALAPLSALYGSSAAQRRRRAAPMGIDVPVVVVGNLIVGGAGKTPCVIAVAESLRAAGWTPGIVSRGYGRSAADGDAPLEVATTTPAAAAGDEPLLIHLRTRMPVVVARDRVAAARHLRRRHPEVNVVLCDDGLQHRALARDLEIWLFDERGAGNGLLLPAGPLREPLPPTVPAHALVLYNAAAPTTPLAGWTGTRRLAGVVPLADWWAGAAPQPFASLHGRRVMAAAGLATPEGFFRMLEAHGLRIDRLPLPDHHRFDTLPWPDDREVVVTEKDAVKLRPERTGTARVWVAALDFRPEPAFFAALHAALPHRPWTTD